MTSIMNEISDCSWESSNCVGLLTKDVTKQKQHHRLHLQWPSCTLTFVTCSNAQKVNLNPHNFPFIPINQLSKFPGSSRALEIEVQRISFSARVRLIETVHSSHATINTLSDTLTVIIILFVSLSLNDSLKHFLNGLHVHWTTVLYRCSTKTTAKLLFLLTFRSLTLSVVNFVFFKNVFISW